jgi:hypothetical protein
VSRVESPTLVHPYNLIDSAEVQTEAMPVPDRYGTHWMPATKKIPPSRDFASAAGAMTVIQDRQALVEALREDHVPSQDRAPGFAPWGTVVREMTHDPKGLVYLPMIIIVGLLVMLWIFKVNGPDTMNYKIAPRAPASVKTTPKTQTPVQPSQRHRKPVVPAPVPSRTKTYVAPVKPSPSRSEAPEPVPTKTVPTPRYTAPPKPKPTKTVEPTPDPKPTQTQTPDPKPTVEPSTRTVEPTQTQEPTREPTREPTSVPAQTQSPENFETPRS